LKQRSFPQKFAISVKIGVPGMSFASQRSPVRSRLAPFA
jgi:hypothetical protein